jgi:hypothetical protein
MGKDIWNVPFEDITLMLKVRTILHLAMRRKMVYTEEERTCKLTLSTPNTVFLRRAIHLPSGDCSHQDLHRPALLADLPTISLQPLHLHLLGSSRRSDKLRPRLHHLLRLRMQTQ